MALQQQIVLQGACHREGLPKCNPVVTSKLHTVWVVPKQSRFANGKIAVHVFSIFFLTVWALRMFKSHLVCPWVSDKQHPTTFQTFFPQLLPLLLPRKGLLTGSPLINMRCVSCWVLVTPLAPSHLRSWWTESRGLRGWSSPWGAAGKLRGSILPPVPKSEGSTEIEFQASSFSKRFYSFDSENFRNFLTEGGQDLPLPGGFFLWSVPSSCAGSFWKLLSPGCAVTGQTSMLIPAVQR